MKKLNTKALNKFYSNSVTPYEMKNLVTSCVENYLNADVKNPLMIGVLQDMGMLMDA